MALLSVLALATWGSAMSQSPLPEVPAGAEAVSLLGTPLSRPQLSADSAARLEADLAAARAAYDKDPQSVDSAVWVGRRLAYLGRFRDAILWYTAALGRHGPDAKLLRHRGHRYLTIRQIDRAISDFETAAKLVRGKPDEIEPDGVPNARNQPISSLHSNIWYHLALAKYLKGDWKGALAAADEGMKVSGNPDRLVSQTYWRYLILRKLGRDSDAKKALAGIRADLDVIENGAYLRLIRVFQGELSEQEVLAGASSGNDLPTTAFGFGAFHLANGNAKRARELFEKATSNSSWPAFGYLAAEAELAMGKG